MPLCHAANIEREKRGEGGFKIKNPTSFVASLPKNFPSKQRGLLLSPEPVCIVGKRLIQVFPIFLRFLSFQTDSCSYFTGSKLQIQPHVGKKSVTSRKINLFPHFPPLPHNRTEHCTYFTGHQIQPCVANKMLQGESFEFSLIFVRFRSNQTENCTSFTDPKLQIQLHS